MTLEIGNAQSSDLTNAVSDVSVASLQTDNSQGSEYTWSDTEWSEYFGLFNEIPELHSAFVMKSIWTCGKGYECDPETKVTLDGIRGFGKDCFRDILFNLDLTKNIGGNSYAEIIRNDEGRLINLKPLDPSTIRHVMNGKGILERFEQVTKLPKGKEEVKKFDPSEIFYLSNCRVADQCHGISRIKAMKNTILAMNENFVDLRKIMHRQARPMIMFKLKTDDATKIAAFVTKMDAACNKGENIYIPDDEDIVSYEVIQLDISQSVMQWRNDLNNKFYRAVGMPLVLFGQAGTTESGGKIEYLGHEQVFEHDQKYLEEQLWSQLAIRIELNSPVTLLQDLQSDQGKDANQGMEIQRNDFQPGRGR